MAQGTDGKFPLASSGIATTPPFRFEFEYETTVVAVSPEVEQAGAAWALVGGSEEEASLELHLIVGHPTEPTLAKRLTLTLPLIAGSGEIMVGSPSISEA